MINHSTTTTTTVRKALAEALHHSREVDGGQRGPPVQLAPLSEVAGPQGAAATVWYVAAAGLLLSTPALGGEVGADKPLDAKTFWLLMAKHKEEQREKEEEQRLAQLVAGRPELEEWLKNGRRKRRKRRKKKVPKSSASRSCSSFSVSGCRLRSTGHLDFSGRRLRALLGSTVDTFLDLFLRAPCFWQSLCQCCVSFWSVEEFRSFSTSSFLLSRCACSFVHETSHYVCRWFRHRKVVQTAERCKVAGPEKQTAAAQRRGTRSPLDVARAHRQVALCVSSSWWRCLQVGNTCCEQVLMSALRQQPMSLVINTDQSSFPLCTVALSIWWRCWFRDVTSDREQFLVSALSQQPVLEAVKSSFLLFKTGLTGKCGLQLDHGALAVRHAGCSQQRAS